MVLIWRFTNFLCTFFLPSGKVMEVLERYKMKQKMEALKEDALKRNVLRCILKYEIQSLVIKTNILV